MQRQTVRPKDGWLQLNLAHHLAQLLDVLERDPLAAAPLVRNMLARCDSSDKKGWRFMMVNLERYSQVMTYLMDRSRRPKVALQVWTEMLCHVRTDSQEIDVTRTELAEAAGCAVTHVSTCLSELEKVGAIQRRHENGRVRLFLNPWVGTHIPLDVSDGLRAEWPDLTTAEAA